MTGYLVPVSKSRARKRKKSTGMQAKVAGETKQTLNNPEHQVKNVLLDEPKIHHPEVHAPRLELTHPAPAPLPAPEPPIRRGMPLRGKALIGGGLLAAGGTGAYLYRRNRVEKSLSLMQHDYPSVMMRTT